MIKINNRVITGNFTGRNIVIKNGNVIIDGHDVTPEGKEISIEITGNVESLDVGACKEIKITGDVGKLDAGSGDVECRDIKGSVRMKAGDLQANIIHGDVESSAGDIDANTIMGSVKTSAGDIKYKK